MTTNAVKKSINIDYFDRVINKIDVEAELKLQFEEIKSTSINYEINSTRQVLIDRVRQVEEAFIEYLKDSPGRQENIFCMFIKAGSFPIHLTSSKVLLGVLILTDFVLKIEHVDSIEELFEKDRNDHTEMNWLLDSTVILYTQLKEEMKKNDSIILTIQHNQFGLNRALSLKKQFFRSLANDAFEHCGRCINVLDLSGNLIQKIGKNHFENLPSLQLLNLNCNSIEKIDACSFEHLQSLQKLDLSSNKLTSITERLFLGLENLVELSLYNNRIKCVERNSFTRLKSLKSLNIGDNPIDGPNSTCPNFIKHQVVTQPVCFEKLAVLNLSLTNLKLVHGNMFICLKNLTTLFLNDNLIEKIENDSFICLSNLIFLDLSYNKIQMLTKRSFVGLFNLQELYLHKNFLKEIEPNSFDHLEMLKYLCIDLYRIEMTQDDLLNNLSRANVKVFDNPNYN